MVSWKSKNDLWKWECCRITVTSVKKSGFPKTCFISNVEGSIIWRVWQRRTPSLRAYARSWTVASGQDILRWELVRYRLLLKICYRWIKKQVLKTQQPMVVRELDLDQRKLRTKITMLDAATCGWPEAHWAGQARRRTASTARPSFLAQDLSLCNSSHDI